MFETTKRFLKEHQDLIVIQSDKGNITTIMVKDQYNTLTEELLSNEENYTKLNNDPSNSIQQKANLMVSELKKQKLISNELASKLMFYQGNASQYYGLPKIHKDVLSLRPIIASIDAPNYKLAEFVKGILDSSYDFSNDFYIKDSYDFAQFINDKLIPPNYVLVSWDVVSLFTNISLELTLKCIEINWTTIQNHCPISKTNFIKIIKFLFDSTIFSYKGTYYKQKHGTPMGSIVSPIIAQFVVDLVLKESLPKLSFEIPFLKKYMDDIITLVPKDKTNESIDIINQYNEKIQFTLEEENENSVSFLDMRIIRKDNILITDWHRKPTSSGRYINWHSYHPTKVKINILRNFRSRITKIVHPTLIDKNLKVIEDLFLKNGYPKKLIKKILYNSSSVPNLNNLTHNYNSNLINNNQNLQNISNTSTITNRNTDIPLNNEQNVIPYLILPFEESLTNLLVKLIPKNKFKIAFKNVVPIKTLFTNVKDKIDNLNRHNVVYKINCLDCDKTYIGQTSTKLKQRISLHKSNIRTNKDTCQLTIHSRKENHYPDFNNVKILDYENNTNKRSFLEMVRIFQNSNCINSRKDISGLSIIFSYLFHIDDSRKSINTTSSSDFSV